MFKIPYIGLPSFTYGKKLREMFKQNYGITIRVCFTTVKVKDYFSLQCRTPTPLLTNVVYKFQCLSDSSKSYIGKTKRHLATRVKEHKQGPSTIQNHLDECSTFRNNYSCDLFAILDSGSNDLYFTIKEAMHIKSCKPWLNKLFFTQGSSFFLNVFG